MKCNVPGCEREAIDNAESGKCPLHAPLGEKDPEKFWTEFEEHFETANGEVKAGNVDAVLNCTGFLFPNTEDRFKSRVFEMNVIFENAEFVRANFEGVRFKKSAGFSQTLFKEPPRRGRSGRGGRREEAEDSASRGAAGPQAGR